MLVEYAHQPSLTLRRIFYRLGPRALGELLAEFGREHLIRSATETKLRRYIERLTPSLLRAGGGDRFPVSPIRIVPSG